jgi:putative serine protease PepD
MSEYETNPQRLPGATDPTAELPSGPAAAHAPTGPQQGQSEQDLPAQATEPVTGSVAAEPVTGVPAIDPDLAVTGVPAADPDLAVTQQQPPVPYPPTTPQWHAGQPHQPGWPGNAGYVVPPAQPPHLGPQPPVWVQPAPAVGPAPTPTRFGKIVATGAAAVVLAVGSGLLGGWAALELNDRGVIQTSDNTPTAAAPVIDRSSLAGIAAATQPSVVNIATGSGEGSGVVLTSDGYILTNNHVVAGARGDTVRVTFADGKTTTASIIGTDPKTDLGVVKAQGVSGLKPAKFGDSGAMQVGDTVLALGSPLGLQGSVTAGIVSALDRTIQVGGDRPQSPFAPGDSTPVSSMSGLLQTDAPINPGNSGGALVNTNGEVIGINSAIATSGQGEGNIGVGFAIPSNKAKQVAEQLMRGGKVSHPFLGVSVTNGENGGAVIAAVQAGSPADKAGLQKGDIVIKLGAKKINASDDLVSAVQSGKAGDQLELTYVRNGEQRTTTVTLGEAS